MLSQLSAPTSTPQCLLQPGTSNTLQHGLSGLSNTTLSTKLSTSILGQWIHLPAMMASMHHPGDSWSPVERATLLWSQTWLGSTLRFLPSWRGRRAEMGSLGAASLLAEWPRHLHCALDHAWEVYLKCCVMLCNCKALLLQQPGAQRAHGWGSSATPAPAALKRWTHSLKFVKIMT